MRIRNARAKVVTVAGGLVALGAFFGLAAHASADVSARAGVVDLASDAPAAGSRVTSSLPAAPSSPASAVQQPATAVVRRAPLPAYSSAPESNFTPPARQARAQTRTRAS